MEQFLTAVTKDVDSYWTNVFKDSGLLEPRVSYMWIPAGQTAASACGDDNGTLGDSAAAYCPADDTLHLAEVRDRHLQRRARPSAARQLAGVRADDRRLLGRVHRRARVRPRGPGRARPLPELRPAAPDDGFELQADCLPAPGPRAPTRRTVSKTVTCRRRWTPPSPSATSTRATRAITAHPSSARRPGTAASSRATRPRAQVPEPGRLEIDGS